MRSFALMPSGYPGDAMSRYVIAAEEVKELVSEGLRPGRLQAQSARVPDGVRHAYDVERPTLDAAIR